MPSRISVGICDDDIKVCELLSNALEQCEKIMRVRIDSKIYYTGEKLLEDLSRGDYFDILFLDVQLKSIDGLRVALKMRWSLHHNFTHIYYITAYRQDIRKVLRTRPMDIIPKPIKFKDINNALQMSIKLMSLTDSKEKCFEYQIQSTHYKVPIKDILYFKKSNNKILIVTKNKNQEFYSTIEKIHKELKEYDFVYTDRSYLVNFSYIESFSGNELKLYGLSESLPVARARYAGLFKKWTLCLSKRNVDNKYSSI